MVGDLLGAVVGHVDHDHAPPSRRTEVGIVDAGAVEPEDPAAAKPPDEAGVDRRVLDEEGIAHLGRREARLGLEGGAVDHVDPVGLQHGALGCEVGEHVGEHERARPGTALHARRSSASRSRSSVTPRPGRSGGLCLLLTPSASFALNFRPA